MLDSVEKLLEIVILKHFIPYENRGKLSKSDKCFLKRHLTIIVISANLQISAKIDIFERFLNTLISNWTLDLENIFLSRK